ncbi:MAG: hypothetical protein WCR54_07815 [Clostridia bacterium]
MVNTLEISGRLVNDMAEEHFTRKNGETMNCLKFKIAVNKANGKAFFLNAVVYNADLKGCPCKTTKGSLIALKGALNCNQLKAKEGEKYGAYWYEIVVSKAKDYEEPTNIDENLEF